MHYSQIFPTTLSLADLSLALPSTNPPQARDTRLTIGIPPNGVDCHTDSEDLHTLTNEMILDTMTNGAQIISKSYGTSKEANGTSVYFPALFQQQTFMSPAWPTFNAAAGCNLTQGEGVYYMPLWYPGTTQPALTRNTPSPNYPGVPITTDIVVFTSVLQGFVATGSLQFCGVLTNSDADQLTQGLFTDPFPTVSGPSLNTSPSGYRQCTANA